MGWGAGVAGVGLRHGGVGSFEVFAVYSAAIRVREWTQLLAFRNFHGEGRLRYYSSSVTALGDAGGMLG